MRRKNQTARHGSCGVRRLDRAMDTEDTFLGERAQFELEMELEAWDWARAAGVSADELRQALRASIATPELRKAA
jgi:hypothetical protein